MENFVLFRHWPPGQWYPKLHKSSFLFLRVPRGRGWQCARPRLHIPIPLSLRQWAAGSGPRTRCLLPRPLPSRGDRWVLHHTLRPHFETLCLSSRPLGSTALPHRGYVYVSPGPACTAPGGLARAPQAVSLAPEDHQTRLRDSVRPASSQVQGQSVHLSVEPGCPCLACRSRGPTGEGRDTAGPSSRDGVRALQRPLLHRSQETRWVTSNLGPACSEPGPCQAPVQDVDAETPLSMRPSLRLGCSDRPERRLLPCLDPPSIPLCVRRASIPVGPPLRAPQPVGASGQPGKEQTLPYAEDLFSRQGVGLGQPHSTSLRGACSVNAEMPGVSPAQEGGSTETFSEAPGAYGILSRYHAARIASYETASALASRPSPEMGMAPRHIPGLTHPVLPSHLQPMVGSCLSSGRSSPRASIQARCCFNRRLCHGLGGHVQRARSRGALDRAPAAVAYQLPRVAGSIACSASEPAIASARALSTRQAYRLKWNLFVDWCSPRREDPRRCPIAVVLSFLQDGLERRLSPSTLKVYVAAIAAHHDAVDGKSLGKHDLVIRFLRGARRLNPPRPHLVPSWDLPSVLSALRGAPFEPLQSVELKFLSLKTVLLSALATVKRVGDLQAFSVDDSCLEFGPADSHVVLRPRPGYVPKVPTMPFRDQVVNLQALPREEADPAIALLCPVRALRIYVDRTQSFRTSDQLFVCFGGQQKGRAVSKQRLAHWIVEAIVLAYQARRLPCPLGVRAHSTRGVASSWALARGASIADICKAAGWATPNTFARFYNLRIEPVSSRVLVSDGQ